jgi:hypothetical protein
MRQEVSLQLGELPLDNLGRLSWVIRQVDIPRLSKGRKILRVFSYHFLLILPFP